MRITQINTALQKDKSCIICVIRILYELFYDSHLVNQVFAIA